MTAISWANAVNGDWSDGADWSTGTFPGPGDDVSISVSGPYIVTISTADAANSLVFNPSEAALLENAGSLTIAGPLTVEFGFVSLNEANTIGGVALEGGVLAFGNAGALGAGTVALSGGGELLATANETLTNRLAFSGSSTVAAAHGTTLNENASDIGIGAGATLNFGAPGEDGVVLWNTGDYAMTNPFSFNVVAGTLKAADSGLADMINFGAQSTAVDAGATLDTGGFNLTLTDLLGGGAVIDSGTAALLTLAAANFSGFISGPQSLVASGAATLSGASTYSGTTTINAGDSLQLGVGGATGSIGGGAISDGGTLEIDRNNALTLTNAISGAGVLKQVGTGVTSIKTANNYTSGTTLSAGTLAIGNGGALGTGTLTFSNGELLGTATETFADFIDFSVSGTTTTFAAAHGTTLNLTGSVDFPGNNTIDIGAPGQDGEVLWSGTAEGEAVGDTVDVLDGTLTAGNAELKFILGLFAGTRVEAGATLDWAGNTAAINNLSGAGTVTDSGAAQTMFLGGTTNFSGTISGALSLTLGNVTLSGLEDYTGGATVDGPVANTGTYDIVSNNGIAGVPAIFFINNGLFEKTGGGGVSDVTSNFVNNGTLNVFSGSIVFSGGFTNDGVIHGLVTQSGSVTTITAPAPPTVSVQNVSVSEGVSIAASSMIAGVSNPSGDSITEYGFYDHGGGTGHFSVGGAAQPDDQWIYVAPANLSTVDYVGGASPGSQTISVDLYDATTKSYSEHGVLTATTTAPPTVNVKNVSVPEGVSIAASSMITGVSNPSGDSITEYGFYDHGGGTGHFTVGGAAQADDQWIYVAPASLGTVDYVGGSAPGSQTISVDVYDATTKSYSEHGLLTAATTAPPTVSVKNVSVPEGASIAASSMIASVSNPSGDSITEYGFYDHGGGSGHFTVGGAAQADDQWIYVAPANLGTVDYAGGSAPGSQTISVDLYDATTESYSEHGVLTATTKAPNGALMAHGDAGTTFALSEPLQLTAVPLTSAVSTGSHLV